MREIGACVIGVALAVAAPGPAPRAEAARLEQQRVDTESRALAAFQDQLKAYAELRDKLEGTLEELPDDASPEQIEAHQRGLAELLQKARARAEKGDIFVRDARAAIRRSLARAVAGEDGARLKAAIMDDNPGDLPSVRVNRPYPDSLPVSSVPSKVLEVLPKLPRQLEYRFVGRRLILLDVQAKLVADVMDNALPR